MFSIVSNAESIILATKMLSCATALNWLIPYIYTATKQMFSGIYWNQPVYLSVHLCVHPTVYKILDSVKVLAGY